MAEIRDRLAAIHNSRKGEISAAVFGQEYMAAEFAMLQLRMICELVALACVVAHGDVAITRSGKFKNDYSAEVIFTKLQAYHPDFFPKPVQEVQRPNGVSDLLDRTDAMTRDEMVKLYRYCLGRLHRDHVKNILKQKRKLYDYKYISDSAERLFWLLDQHIISLSRDDGRHAWVKMDAGGKVRWDWMILRGPGISR